MAKVKATQVLNINYVSQEAKPPGGFRLFYAADPDATEVTSDDASISLPLTDHPGIIDDDIENNQLVVQLPYRLPLFEIPDGDTERSLFLAIAGVDSNGNVGALSAPIELTLEVPTFDEVFSLAPEDITLSAEQLTATVTFADDTGWTTDAEWVIGGGVATFTGVGDNGELVGTMGATTAVGETWRIAFDVVSVTGNPNFWIWPGLPEVRKVTVNSTGTKFADIYITDSLVNTLTLMVSNTGDELVIDNVSAKRIV